MCDHEVEKLTKGAERKLRRISEQMDALRLEAEHLRDLIDRANGVGPHLKVKCTNMGWVGDKACGEESFIRDFTPHVTWTVYQQGYSERHYRADNMKCPKCGAVNRLIMHREHLYKEVVKHSVNATIHVDK